MSGAETPGGLAHTGRRPESREGAKAGRKARSLLLLCTLCILYRVPLGDVASPPAPLWLVRNPALTCQSGPRGAPIQGLEPVLDTDWKEHVATQNQKDAGHCGTCTSFRETSRQLFYGSFRERRGYCPETGLEVEAEGIPVCPPPHAPQTPRQGSWSAGNT